MSQFIQFFGEQIMVLWKFALLRKRLLIFSPPPVGVVCYRGETPTEQNSASRNNRLRFDWASCVSSVYCCCCLANVSLPGVGVSVPELRPFFYINVADISALETEVSYVACESELQSYFHLKFSFDSSVLLESISWKNNTVFVSVVSLLIFLSCVITCNYN